MQSTSLIQKPVIKKTIILYRGISILVRKHSESCQWDLLKLNN